MRAVLGFNPRLRAGGDYLCIETYLDPCPFQPTPPRGRRLVVRRPRRAGIGVSTHASAREATSRRWCWRLRTTCFDPRLRAGGDLLEEFGPLLFGVFQPTPPRGRRRGLYRLNRREAKFQPTPPRGRRRHLRLHRCVATEFQPTPPRGRRHSGARAATHPGPFQPTPPRGRRRWPCARSARWACFNPRLRAGGDVARQGQCLGAAVSTHASAREATRITGY